MFALIAPQIALASWWNPVTWSIWHIFQQSPKQEEVIKSDPSTTTTATSTIKIPQQKEVTAKENKNSVISLPKKEIVEIPKKPTEPASQVAPKQEEQKTSIVTFQNGAIAEIDAKGNVVRWIKEASIVPSIPASLTQTQKSTNGIPELSILLRGITSANTSGRFSWRTSVPSNSRLVLYTYGLTDSVTFYPSLSGYSAEHFVEIPDALLVSGSHGYSVEAWDNGNTAVSSTVLFHSQKADGYIID